MPRAPFYKWQLGGSKPENEECVRPEKTDTMTERRAMAAAPRTLPHVLFSTWVLPPREVDVPCQRRKGHFRGRTGSPREGLTAANHPQTRKVTTVPHLCMPRGPRQGPPPVQPLHTALLFLRHTQGQLLSSPPLKIGREAPRSVLLWTMGRRGGSGESCDSSHRLARSPNLSHRP